ncbi:MAG: 4Fe-4S binding protein [Candidatus Poribacteria bacterium]
MEREKSVSLKREISKDAKTALLICGDWRHGVRLTQWSIDEDVEAHVVPNLCKRPEEISELLTDKGIGRLVLGLCPGEYSMAEVQTQARKVGLDALGVEIVHLKGMRLEKAKILLAAAVARARAYAGSEPENAKPSLPTRMSRRELFKIPLLEYRAVPSIQESLCFVDLGCRTCVQLCPCGALERADGNLQHDKMKCESCSLCVTACPRDAIINPAITTEQLEAQVRALLDFTTGNIKPRGIIFTCQHAPEQEGSRHDSWMPVKLPCVGMALPSWFLAPLLMGASAVCALPCQKGCAIGQAQLIAGRVAYCQEFLRLIGAPKDLVRFSRSPGPMPPEEGKRVSLEYPFNYKTTANVLMRIAQEYDADQVVLEHHNSPLGIVEVRADVCSGCGMCARVCPTGALLYDTGKEGVFLTFDATTCVACGQCLLKCPEAEREAIRLYRKTDLTRISRGRKIIYQGKAPKCVACGSPIAPSKMIRRIEELLGNEYAATADILTRYCPACRGVAAFHGSRIRA